MPRWNSIAHLLCVAALALSCAGGAQGTEGRSAGYRRPPPKVAEILEAPPPPLLMVAPSRRTVAILDRTLLPPVAELARPMVRLAGTRIDLGSNAPHRGLGIGPTRGQRIHGITIRTIETGKDVVVAVPRDADLGNIAFSPDGAHIAFTQRTGSGVFLWIAEAATGRARALSPAPLNSALGAPCEWLRDGRSLLCLFIDETRGAPPEAPRTAERPIIAEHEGPPAPAVTYADLLRNDHDEVLFDYYARSRLALVAAGGGQRTNLGDGIFERASMSPDGEFVLVSRLVRPYSRALPASRFPKQVEVWDRTGRKVATVAELTSGEGVPLRGVPAGPRAVDWRPGEPATLIWVEALDGGDSRRRAERRDRLLALKSPFQGQARELARTEFRFDELFWTTANRGILTERDNASRRRRAWLLDDQREPRLLWNVSTEDRYADSGRPVVLEGDGRVLEHAGAIYLTGEGASPEGDRPFLDRFDLEARTSERLFRCDTTSYERVVAVLTDDATSVLTRYETPTTPGNYYVRRLPGATREVLTTFVDPAVRLGPFEMRTVKYRRRDGIDLSTTLYLPADRKPGERLPLVLWAYPREYADSKAASQVMGSPNRFVTVSGPFFGSDVGTFSPTWHMLFLTQGYAVLDNPPLPIVGPAQTANDTFVEQLVAGAEAVIEAAAATGLVDRDRVGVAGHSYGAFMVGNLLAHSDLFRAGIARTGAYNRSLTPFGFQNERRTFWQAPAVYSGMSPFWFADRIKEPVLLVHGEIDNNSGTDPVQSMRFYAALRGHGTTVRYVRLPHESHGYVGRESVLHVVAEMIEWFDKHVKTPVTAAAVK